MGLRAHPPGQAHTGPLRLQPDAGPHDLRVGRTVLLGPDTRDGDRDVRVDPQRRSDKRRRSDRDRLDVARPIVRHSQPLGRGRKNNPIVLSRPRRQFSGVDVLQSNFFDSAVVKISGMPDSQLDEFDAKLAVVLYFENEDEANRTLLDDHFLDSVKSNEAITREDLLRIYENNSNRQADPGVTSLLRAELFDHLLRERIIKFAVVIIGQGPEAYGMPEMFTPMQHVNANRHLKKLAMILTDGRYSGVSYGAVIGHITPEAKRGGGILYLKTGDLIQSNLAARNITLVDREVLRENGEIVVYTSGVTAERRDLGAKRLRRINRRLLDIAPTNRMRDVTDASHGVVPEAVAECASQTFVEFACLNVDQENI